MSGGGFRGDLPDNAYAAAISALPDMTPARLRRLLRDRPAVVVHSELRSGEPSLLDRLIDPDSGAPRRATGRAERAARASEYLRWWGHELDTDPPGRYWARLRSAGVSVVRVGDALYPRRLLRLPDPPELLQVTGDLSRSDGPAVGLVGTRRATRYGIGVAGEFGAELARRGVVVISGLALGIDAAAHAGAIAAHAGAIAAHTGTSAEHAGPASEHTGTVAPHTGTFAEHAGPASEHAGPESERPSSSGARRASDAGGLRSDSGELGSEAGDLGSDAAGASSAGHIAVVAGGVDIVYPPRNRALHRKLVECGAVISEAPLGTRPVSWRFPLRNRIIAGLCDVLVVVESSRQGGSMHTVEAADRIGVPVLAVPGSIRSPQSEGTNLLISQGGAHPALDVGDILAALVAALGGNDPRLFEPRMSFGTGYSRAAGRSRDPGELARVLGCCSPAEREVARLLTDDVTHVDTLCEAAGLSLQEAVLALDRLSELGLAEPQGAGWVRR